jgi:hypothetical protein
MIATRIIFRNANTNIQTFEEFDQAAFTSTVRQQRDEFVKDLKFSIKQGWIKNLHNERWDDDSKSFMTDYYSDDLHQVRYFQNYLAAKEYFSTGVDALNCEGWSLKVETVADAVAIPYVDAQRIFNEDIDVLV